MNRVVNILSFLILVTYALMVFASVYDLSVSNIHLKGLKYQKEIFTAIALVIFLLGMIRVQRRWQGMRDMKRYSGFIYVTQVARKHRLHGVVVTSLEILFFAAVFAFCLLIQKLEPSYVLPMLVVLSILLFESFIFLALQLRGGPAFRVGFDTKVIAYFDREMHLFYYEGLKKVELYQKDLINLGYRDDLNLAFETTVIEENNRVKFRETLVQTLTEKSVYVDDALRNWK